MMCADECCTGVHDNNRYHELCPAALKRKRDKDDRYYSSNKGYLVRLRKTQISPAAYAELEQFVSGGRQDELVVAAIASDDPDFILRATWEDVFGRSGITADQHSSSFATPYEIVM
jgi:hypothetical protein